MTHETTRPIPQTCSEQADSAWELRPVLDWLSREGRLIRNPARLVDQLCRRLQASGAPLARLRCNFNILHPEVQGRSFTWWRDHPSVEEYSALHGIRHTDAYLGSPIQTISEQGVEVRVRLDQAERSALHGSLVELKEAGMIDYLGLPMRFNAGSTCGFLVATDRPGGFDAGDLANFRTLVDFFAPVMESIAMRMLARALLDTYVGPRTGKRVFNGQVRRGDMEQLEAVLWFSDLRNFTALSETLSGDELLSMLNSYFEVVTQAVTARGGEVLRFIGDAMLIVFPRQEEQTRDQACCQAVTAAIEAFREMARLNRTRSQVGEPAIEFGLGLHWGEVVYGNVGAPNRLDFTVLGAAVNRTARLEALTKKLKVPLLMSAAVAASISLPLVNLGAHRLRGVADRHQVFTLQGCQPGQPCRFEDPLFS